MTLRSVVPRCWSAYGGRSQKKKKEERRHSAANSKYVRFKLPIGLS